MLTKQQLDQFLKRTSDQQLYDAIIATMQKYGITKKLDQASFVAQCYTESKFTTYRENLNYGLKALQANSRFNGKGKKYTEELDFTKPVDYSKYVGNPKAIGSRMYGSRGGNGNEASGEGYF